MLGDGDAGSGADDGGGRGDVERAQPVAAGADNVENFAGTGFGIQRRRDGFVAQGAGKRRDFSGRFAFLSERGQKIRLGFRRDFFVGEPFNRQAALCGVERLPGGKLLDESGHEGILSGGACGSN